MGRILLFLVLGIVVTISLVSAIVLNYPLDGELKGDTQVELNATSELTASNLSFWGLTESGSSDYYDVNLTGIVAWYRFEEDVYTNTAGEVKDFYGNYNGISFADANISTDGHIGNASDYDGAGDYLHDFGLPASTWNNGYTISMWVYHDGSDSSWGIIDGDDTSSSDRTFQVRYQSDYRFYFGDLDNVETRCLPSGVTTFDDFDRWVHVVVNYNLTDGYIKVDGVKGGECSTSDYDATDNPNIRLGNLDAETMDGRLDDVMIFNRSLTEDEELSLYRARKTELCRYDNTGLEDKTCNYVGAPKFFPEDDLLAYYKFDRKNRTMSETGKYNITTVSGAIAQNNTGMLMDSYNFDGADDYLSVPYDADLNFGLNGITNFTFNIWLKSDVATQSSQTWPVRQHRDAWGLNADGGFTCMWRTETTGAFPSVVLKIGTSAYQDKWVMITCVHDDSKIYGYFNGELMQSAILADNTIQDDTWPDYIIIGNEVTPPSGTRAWDGNIDEFAIWNKSLTAEEIADMYHFGEEKHYWTANDTNGTSSEVGDVESFEIILTNPIITLYEPMYESNDGMINFTAVSGSGTINTTVNITLNGVQIDYLTSNLTQNYINTTVLDKGEYNLTILVTDLSGLTTTKEKIFSVVKFKKINLFSDSKNFIINVYSNSKNWILNLFGGND